MDRPTALPVSAPDIPPTLRAGRYFVLWRYELRKDKKGESKWMKVPKRIDGSNASSTDSASWTIFDRVTEVYLRGGFDGIGHVMTPEQGLVGIDFDHARDAATGRIESWAEEYVAKLSSYTEVSPSRTGLRIFITATLPPGRKSKSGIEMYDRGRYLTLTGYPLPGTRSTVEPRQAELEELRRRVFGEERKLQPATASPSRSTTRPLRSVASVNPDGSIHVDFRNVRDGSASIENADPTVIESALSYISADERETWLACGMAIHSQLGESGRSIWDAWSMKSAKYEAADQQQTWNHFHADGGVGIGTLFRLARNAGWPGVRTVMLYDTATGEVVEERICG